MHHDYVSAQVWKSAAEMEKHSSMIIPCLLFWWQLLLEHKCFIIEIKVISQTNFALIKTQVQQKLLLSLFCQSEIFWLWNVSQIWQVSQALSALKNESLQSRSFASGVIMFHLKFILVLVFKTCGITYYPNLTILVILECNACLCLTDENCLFNPWWWNRSRDLHGGHEDIWSS